MNSSRQTRPSATLDQKRFLIPPPVIQRSNSDLQRAQDIAMRASARNPKTLKPKTVQKILKVQTPAITTILKKKSQPALTIEGQSKP